MTTENISAAELRRLIDYDPETGRFTSRVRRGRIAVGDVVGTRRNDGYVKIGIGGRQYYAHRLAWLHVYGEYPSVVDHVDRNPSNNRLTNLRLVNLSQNQQNQVAHINNTSGYKDMTAPVVIGVDPARGGADSTVIVVRRARDIVAIKRRWRIRPQQ